MLNPPGEVAALVLAALLGVYVGWVLRGVTASRDAHRPRHAASRRSASPIPYDLSTGDLWVPPRDGKRGERAHAAGRRVEHAEPAPLDTSETGRAGRAELTHDTAPTPTAIPAEPPPTVDNVTAGGATGVGGADAGAAATSDTVGQGTAAASDGIEHSGEAAETASDAAAKGGEAGRALPEVAGRGEDAQRTAAVGGATGSDSAESGGEAAEPAAAADPVPPGGDVAADHAGEVEGAVPQAGRGEGAQQTAAVGSATGRDSAESGGEAADHTGEVDGAVPQAGRGEGAPPTAAVAAATGGEAAEPAAAADPVPPGGEVAADHAGEAGQAVPEAVGRGEDAEQTAAVGGATRGDSAKSGSVAADKGGEAAGSSDAEPAQPATAGGDAGARAGSGGVVTSDAAGRGVPAGDSGAPRAAGGRTPGTGGHPGHGTRLDTEDPGAERVRAAGSAAVTTVDAAGAAGHRATASTVERSTAGGNGVGARRSERDDLQQVVGIGPVIQRVLAGAGIRTYRQLAELAGDGEALARAGTALGGDVRARIERQRWVEQAKELHFQKYGEQL